MGIITSIVNEFSRFMDVDKKTTRDASRIHPSIKIAFLGAINVLISQYFGPLDLMAIVLVLLLMTVYVRGVKRAFFQPFFFILLFSLMSSGGVILINMAEFSASLRNFSVSDLFSENIIGRLTVFNLRLLAMLWVTRVFLFSTPMSDITRGLRSLKVPTIIVNLISISYRYIFVLAEEFLAVSIAKELRAPAPRSMRERFDALSMIYASTFNRALKRSSTVQIAMSLRGNIDQFTTHSSKVQVAKSIAFVCGAVSLIGFLLLAL